MNGHERDPLSRILARHRGVGRRHERASGGRFLDDHSMARILEASLGVLAAIQTLAAVTEDVVRERRNRLLEQAAGDERPSSDRDQSASRERIPLTY